MRPDLAALPPRYLRTKEAADFLSLSARTLEKHRTYGTGPAYHKLGGRVVYAIEDLQAWVGRGAVTSTSDPRGQVLPAKRHALASLAWATQILGEPGLDSLLSRVNTRTPILQSLVQQKWELRLAERRLHELHSTEPLQLGNIQRHVGRM